MSANTPLVLITPEAREALELEAERAGIGGDLVGGLLFGYPVDERRRLVVYSVRPRPEVGFGQKGFSLDQSRTSQQLAAARKLASQADYCGVWYLHRTPDPELTDDEWVQAQGVLEDPDFRFKDLVCLVLCLYSGDLNTYAFSFNLHHSTRGQLPEPTDLRVVESVSTPAPQPTEVQPAHAVTASPPPTAWYKSPAVAERLEVERRQLEQKYHVEPAVTPRGQVVFRLQPKSGYGKLVFYLSCGSGFPNRAPEAFISAGGKRYPLVSPGLNDWSVERQFVAVADELIEWTAWSLDQYVAAAEEALNRGDYREAADLLTVVLSINPRTPGAARLLARAQAPLRERELVG